MANGFTQARAEKFIRAWKSSSSIVEVAKKLGMRAGAVRSTASQLRALGIELPHMRGGRQISTLDLKALNAIATEGR